MKAWRVLLIVGAVLLAGVSAQAAEVQVGEDPAVPLTSLTPFGANFTGSGGSGSLILTNNSGFDWTSLTIIITGTPMDASAIACGSFFFASCDYSASGKVHTFYFSGGTGILDGQSFRVSWSGWSSDTLVVVDPVPEPGTMMLLGAGLLGLGVFVRRKQAWLRAA